MQVLKTSGWEDFELLDSGRQKRLERFGKFITSRPDPQAIWEKSLNQEEWDKADAVFENDKWITKGNFPDKWLISYKGLRFYAKLTPFKHVGIFPEQSLNWDYIEDKVKSALVKPSILNLFAYTGISSLVAAKNGAMVTHVDASKPSVAWARENQQASMISDKQIRWIIDDAITFTAREIRRGNRYDGIIMDPPVYGHGPNNEKWDFNESFPALLDNCSKLLSNNPIFVITNAYAVSSSAIMLNNLFEDFLPKGNLEYGELALEQKNKRLLSTGIFARISY